MEKDRKRALRRHHYARLKSKVDQYNTRVGGRDWGVGSGRPWWEIGKIWWEDHPDPKRNRVRTLGFSANTWSFCSGCCCGNPRRNFRGSTKLRLTIQEQKADEDFENQLDEVLSVSWTLYAVECNDGTIYTGITNDLEKRLAAHNSGKGAKYTRSRTPVRLLAVWDYLDRSSASSAEYHFKRLSRKEKLEKIRLRGCE
jgi:putative endonuclease